MKYTKLLILLSATLSPAGFAAIPTALPAFKSEKQLTTWREEQATKSTTLSASESSDFYTGKPYVHSSKGYAFKYRTYTPVESRWTSEDPSGFPDGPNNHKYVDCPTSTLDFLGLLTVTGKLTPDTPTATKNVNNTEYVVYAHTAKAISGSSNLSGNFDVTDYDAQVTVNMSGWMGGVNIRVEMSGLPAAGSNMEYHWLQTISVNKNPSYVDILPTTNPNTPFYDIGGDAGTLFFHDAPSRNFTSYVPTGGSFLWEATLNYVGYNKTTKAISYYGGITYGFRIE